MKRQMHVFYTGKVQGVGFRFTARDIASANAVCGWVKNLPDGRVELLLEGEEEAVKSCLKKINQSFSYYIRDYQMQWFAASGKYNNFSIEFY
jgi:acylphosphatase